MLIHDAEYLLDNFHHSDDPLVLAARDCILAEHHLTSLSDTDMPDTAVCRADVDDAAWRDLLLRLDEVREARALIQSRIDADAAHGGVFARLAKRHESALHDVDAYWEKAARKYLETVGLKRDTDRCPFCGEVVDRAAWEFEGRCVKCQCVVCLDDDGEGWS